MSDPYGGRRLVVDSSAFQHGGNLAVQGEWLEALRAGQLYRSPILDFEVLYSARNAREYEELRGELDALKPLELTGAIVGAALDAQAALAARAAAFHRLPHQDYLVAAVAAAHGLGVLHYDSDYDRIAEHARLAFESVWIAERATLGQETDPMRKHRQVINHSLGQFSGDRAKDVLERVLDLVEGELRADSLQLPARP